MRRSSDLVARWSCGDLGLWRTSRTPTTPGPKHGDHQPQTGDAHVLPAGAHEPDPPTSRHGTGWYATPGLAQATNLGTHIRQSRETQNCAAAISSGCWSS